MLPLLLPVLLAVSLQFGSVSEPLVDVDIDHVNLVDVLKDATSGMTKTRLGEFVVYYRFSPVPERDQTTIDVIVEAHGHFLRLAQPLQFEESGQLSPPRIALAVTDINAPVISFELTATDKLVERRLVLMIDLRAAPRATTIEGTHEFGHGACGAPDAVFSPHTSMSCEWNTERKDYVCRQSRFLVRDWGKRIATRSFTLFGREPITGEKDVRVPHELLTGGERSFAGEGFVEVIPIADGIDFFAIPSTGRFFELHGWVVDRPAKRVISVMTTMLEQPLRANPDAAFDNDPPFTPDHVHLKSKVLTPLPAEGVKIVPFTVTDAHTTALFWLGYDGNSAGLLRVATDAEEYLSCNVLVRPASATSEPFIEQTPAFAAMLHVAGAAPRYADLDLHLLDDTACTYDSRVTWNHGFVAKRRDVTHCAAKDRKKLTVTEDGRVVLAVLPTSP
jgi:hypothetical protein